MKIQKESQLTQILIGDKIIIFTMQYMYQLFESNMPKQWLLYDLLGRKLDERSIIFRVSRV